LQPRSPDDVRANYGLLLLNPQQPRPARPTWRPAPSC